MDLTRLIVFAVGSDITNMRIGQRHDLTAVTGVCENFLIARDRGIEYNLTDRQAHSTDGVPLEHRAVGKRKQCLRHV